VHSADPAVYRAVLDSIAASRGRHRRTQFVVTDSTFTSGGFSFEGSRLPGVDSAVLADFQSRNAESRSLRYLPSLGLSIPVVLISRDYLKSFLKSGPEEYWSEFYRRHPGSAGSIGFTSIGYSRDGNVALLEVDQSCGSVCGELSAVVVKRERGRWRVTFIQVTVVS
jgi:hypothetical protein